jgi:hypothetical protein
MAFLKATMRRLAKVKTVLATWPIPQHVVDEAFDMFRWEGELPEDQRLAELVCRQAQFGSAQGGTGPASAAGRRLIAIVVQSEEGEISKPSAPPTVRENLFDEAVYRPETVRRWAREALRVLVWRGGDVTKRDFGQEHGMPEFGTVGMHVLGYPRRLAKAPYKEQGKRLFDRYDDIRRRMDLSPDDDFELMAEAYLAFEVRGELPADRLLRDYVLAEYEIQMLREQRAGRDVAKVMALLDKVATAQGAEQVTAAVADLTMLVAQRG